MFIQIEATPNPASLKFHPGRSLVEGEGVDIRSDVRAREVSPLAARLFEVEGVEGVFLGHDFISVTKGAEADWTLMKPLVLGVMMEHLTAGLPVLNEGVQAQEQEAGPEISEEDRPIVEKIISLLDERVRPAVAQDGGDIVFHGFDKGVVYLAMRGACAGCPSSTATLKIGIENMLRYYIPEVIEVRAYGGAV